MSARTVLLGTVALTLLLHVIPPLVRPGAFMQDDSYFYLQIADNIVGGIGSTFHGVTPTNGYHPLWMAGAVLAAFLAGGDKTVALHIVVVLQALLALGAALIFRRLVRLMGLEFGIVGIAVILSYLLGTSIYGSEAHVNALTLTAALLSLWEALSCDRHKAWFTTGLLFGLAILARLDNVFVIGALGVLGILHNRQRGLAATASRTALTLLGGSVVLVPYLAYNAVEYGHLMPISGAIKSTFPSFAFDLNRLGKMGKLSVPFGVVALTIGQFLDDCGRRKVLWRGLGAGVIVHALYVTGFTDHYTFWAWYYVSAVVAAGLAAAFLPQWISARFTGVRAEVSVRALVSIVTVIVLFGGATRAWLKAFNPIQIGPVAVDLEINRYRWPEEFARWMKQHMPVDGAVFVTDWPGAIAYYSDRTVVPMDGLVNDFRYNDDLLAAGAESYACGHGLRFVFGFVGEDGRTQSLAINAPLYRQPAGTLTLAPENMLVKVRDVVSRPEDTPPYAIWRLTCPDLPGSRRPTYPQAQADSNEGFHSATRK